MGSERASQQAFFCVSALLFAASAAVTILWCASMSAMMLPMFLKTRRSLAETKTANIPASLSLMASGYFAVWLAVGAGIYALGIGFAATAMRSESFSRAVPVLSGVSLIAAGAFQFTRWKMTGLLRCRSPLGCAAFCPECETSFLLGCKQGAACCVCCTAVPFECAWTAQKAAAVDALGQTVPTQIADGRLRLAISLTPVFIEP